jgi:GTP-binding protein HflX
LKSVTAKDLLFATLDPTMRRVDLPPGRSVILSDTVGFISNLPTHLVAAFRATLEEVTEADVVVHVRDVSHTESEAQRQDVEAVLTELGLGARVEEGLIEALNKIDRLDQERRGWVANEAQRSGRLVPISAVTGEGIDRLLAQLKERLDKDRRVVEIAVDLADGASLAWLYRHGQVLKRTDDDTVAHLTVGLAPADLQRFEFRREQARPR